MFDLCHNLGSSAGISKVDLFKGLLTWSSAGEMTPQEQVAAALESLVTESNQLIKSLSGDFQAAHAPFVVPYQTWYTKGLSLVTTFAPDRLAEFRRYYEADPKRKLIDGTTYVIQDYVRGLGPHDDRYGNPAFDGLNAVRILVYSQATILIAIRSRLESILADIDGALASTLEDSTLEAASRLIKINLRAAGALAGVVIEEHLERTASARKLKIAKKNPTIADFNDLLREAGVHDLASWRKVQYLADIRNKCAHKKDAEPTPEEVNELIAGASWLAKHIS